MTAGRRPVIVVVDADGRARQAMRAGLENAGVDVVEAASAAEAEAVLGEETSGVVLDPRLPDADGLTFAGDVRRRLPGIRVVLYGPGKDDAVAVAAALGLAPGPGRHLAVVELLRGEVGALAEDWRELCRWDPLLPPDSQPPIAAAVITAVADAVDNPQPLGWGPDPEIEKVVDVFAMSLASLDGVIGQLVCLGEALRRRIRGRVPLAELAETHARVQMVLDRAIGVAAQRTATRLEQEAFVDPLTELLNRRALMRDLNREIGRAERYARPFAVVLADVDGLKRINDTEGHMAGDAVLRSVAGRLREGLRTGDAAYRLGGDEFAMVLPEVGTDAAEAVAERVGSGTPTLSWGTAGYPDDGREPEPLLAVADDRLYARRSARA